VRETHHDVFFTTHDPRVAERIRFLFEEFNEGKEPDPKVVLPITPEHRFPRMLQQNARFTLHMPGTEDISSGVLRHRVSKDSRRKLQQALRMMGINWATLFPDLDHLCCELKSELGFI
jgi:hypothetical protein